MNTTMTLYEVSKYSLSEPKIREIKATRITAKCYYTYSDLFEKEDKQSLVSSYSAVFKSLEEAEKHKKELVTKRIEDLKLVIKKNLEQIKVLEAIYS